MLQMEREHLRCRWISFIDADLASCCHMGSIVIFLLATRGSNFLPGIQRRDLCEDTMSGDHDHGDMQNTPVSRLWMALGLTGAFMSIKPHSIVVHA
jgi:hypothetical protein